VSDIAPSLGLKRTENRLVDYDPAWAEAFGHERERIAGVLGGLAKGIEHGGSTSVPGLRAKPIIDIYVGVAPPEDWEKCQAPLEALGYDYAANAGVPGSHVFGRGRDLDERTHLLHVVDYDGPVWRAVLAFRNALRSNAGLRARYLAVKEAAIAAEPNSRPRYNELKSAFFAQLRFDQP
jgi:GrpB-like predicted nucleotidyltransferase (UPF0157 family)